MPSCCSRSQVILTPDSGRDEGSRLVAWHNQHDLRPLCPALIWPKHRPAQVLGLQVAKHIHLTP